MDAVARRRRHVLQRADSKCQEDIFSSRSCHSLRVELATSSAHSSVRTFGLPTKHSRPASADCRVHKSKDVSVNLSQIRRDQRRRRQIEAHQELMKNIDDVVNESKQLDKSLKKRGQSPFLPSGSSGRISSHYTNSHHRFADKNAIHWSNYQRSIRRSPWRTCIETQDYLSERLKNMDVSVEQPRSSGTSSPSQSSTHSPPLSTSEPLQIESKSDDTSLQKIDHTIQDAKQGKTTIVRTNKFSVFHIEDAEPLQTCCNLASHTPLANSIIETTQISDSSIIPSNSGSTYIKSNKNEGQQVVLSGTLIDRSKIPPISRQGILLVHKSADRAEIMRAISTQFGYANISELNILSGNYGGKQVLSFSGSKPVLLDDNSKFIAYVEGNKYDNTMNRTSIASKHISQKTNKVNNVCLKSVVKSIATAVPFSSISSSSSHLNLSPFPSVPFRDPENDSTFDLSYLCDNTKKKLTYNIDVEAKHKASPPVSKNPLEMRLHKSPAQEATVLRVRKKRGSQIDLTGIIDDLRSTS